MVPGISMSAMTTSPLRTPFRQLGHVVEDLDRAVASWSERLQVGPWLIIRNIALPCTFRGRPSEPLIDIALSYMGEMQIELIQQRNGADSPYRAFIDQGRFGLHHAAVLTERVDEDVERLGKAGLQLACDIRVPAGHYVYFDSPVPGDNTYLELIEATPAMMDMFRQGMASSATWDGKSAPTVIDFARM
jgi:methylmalonyl-CoA/ethylmalonyl-CoA epimerase